MNRVGKNAIRRFAHLYQHIPQLSFEQYQSIINEHASQLNREQTLLLNWHFSPIWLLIYLRLPIIFAMLDNFMSEYHSYDEVLRVPGGHALFLGDMQAAQDFDFLQQHQIRTGNSISTQWLQPPATCRSWSSAPQSGM
jgi:hypothetical protein